MAKKNRKLRLSASERNRRRLQAIKNFRRGKTKAKSLNRSPALNANVARRRMRFGKKTSKAISFLGRPSVGGFIYGLARVPLNNMTKNLLRNVPVLNKLGGVADEIFMWGIATAISANTKGDIKKIAKYGQAIEMSSLGKQINLGGLGGVLGTNQVRTTAPVQQVSTTQAGQFPPFI